MRVIVVGNGQPARAVIKAFADFPDVSIAALLTSDARAQGPEGTKILPERLIRDAVKLAEEGLLNADWLIVANSTTIVPAEIVRIFAGRAINFHPGLLPNYAGLHTHQWAIRNGETEFGVTVHLIEASVDTGDVIAQVKFPIDPHDTGLSLFQKCMRRGTELISQVAQQIAAGDKLEREPQDLGLRQIYRHSDSLGSEIDWYASAQSVKDFVRAGNYAPFNSPTYTATISLAEETPITVVEVEIGGSSDLSPGAIVSIEPSGPCVACGDGLTVRLNKAFRGNHLLDEAGWRALLKGIERVTQSPD